MTENKRFTIGDRALQEVYGGCIPAILDGGVPCTQSQVLKLLNELNEEKEQLKKYNLRITKVLEDGGVILTKHQLKSLIEMKNDDESSEIRHLRSANARLKDEIIALREYIQKNEMK